MPHLTGTVGEGGANARHDVALVQAYITLAHRHGKAHDAKTECAIDGGCGDGTKRAIRRFQDAHKLLEPPGPADALSGLSAIAALVARAAAAGAKPAFIAPADSTWTKLVASVPREFSDLRVFKGGKTVYVASPDEDRGAAVDWVTNGLTFHDSFRGKVVEVINRIHRDTGIAVTPCYVIDERAGSCTRGQILCDAGRRPFEAQARIARKRPRVTWKGPGESNHNYGRAVDLGFRGLRWLDSDGKVEEFETSWLHKLDKGLGKEGYVPRPEAVKFWDVLCTTGEQVGLYSLGKDDTGKYIDPPHLQQWHKNKVVMARRLAKLLNDIGRMRWSAYDVKVGEATVWRYKCDFGYGSDLFDVGTSEDIWDSNAKVDEAKLREARSRAGNIAAAYVCVSRGVAAPRLGAALAARGVYREVTVRDVIDMKNALRANFDRADDNWTGWTPF